MIDFDVWTRNTYRAIWDPVIFVYICVSILTVIHTKIIIFETIMKMSEMLKLKRHFIKPITRLDISIITLEHERYQNPWCMCCDDITHWVVQRTRIKCEIFSLNCIIEHLWVGVYFKKIGFFYATPLSCI